MTTPSTGERMAWRSTWSFDGTQAFFELAQARGRLPQFVGGRLLITIARIGHARLQLGRALARQRQFAARFTETAARFSASARCNGSSRARGT